MKRVSSRRRYLPAGATILFVSGLFTTGTAIQAQEESSEGVFVEEVVVTAQRRAQSLQEVPISVSAFDAAALDRNQIESFTDVQLNTPNLSFSKTNFTTSSFQIRGIGNATVGAAADAGVSVHVNDLPLTQARLYELEYFDIERLEILRGPQGTLFGRNATGGLVNMITAKPQLDDFFGSAEVEVGDYSNRKVKGMLNIPISDTLGARFAGILTQRDGYTDNLFDGGSIDGRDMYGLRGSLRWQASAATTVDLMVSWFDESSDRLRSQKQMCNRDPVGNLGCLPDTLEFENPNSMASLFGIVATDVAAGPLGLVPFGTDLLNATENPADMREVYNDFLPKYESDELLVNLSLEHVFENGLTLNVSGGYQETMVFSETDYDATIGRDLTLPDGFATLMPNVSGALYQGGLLPLSEVDDTDLGVIGGNVRGFHDRLFAYDRSTSNGEQWMVESRLSSDFDGPLNFLAGFIYFEYESHDVDYFVASNTTDYFSFVSVFNQTGIDGVGVPSPYFRNETPLYQLESTGIFGELYYDLSDTIKITAGLRYTRDDKTLRDGAGLFDGVPLPLGSEGPATLPPFRNASDTFDEMTGRFVIDWAVTEDTLVYGSYSRGYKPGGFNPPFDPNLFPNTAVTFEPEFINAFEIGAKNTLLNGAMQLNLTGFWYDYEGLQISRIINRTAFNDNVDAEISGLEAEMTWAATDRLLLNANLSLISTEVKDVSLIDTRDPAGGTEEATVIKDLTNAQNCVLLWNGGPDPATTLPAVDPGLALLPFSDCAALAAIPYGALGLPYEYTDGVEKDVDGNSLPNTPEFSFNVGAQYSFTLPGGHELTPRIDYYWQDDSEGRIFGSPIDRIDSWDIINAQVTLMPEDGGWYLKAFVQNLDDSDAVTGLYVADPSVGLYTNVFTLEPRRYGLAFGINFD
ncbi:TonB-dependent receptor [Lentisalinibacter sediminis]|uniref:TonB-dependent receptor n=1 Tax=Lentisalinibacter sediminis TaxID=2992237 RepID=UPI0038679B10